MSEELANDENFEVIEVPSEITPDDSAVSIIYIGDDDKPSKSSAADDILNIIMNGQMDGGKKMSSKNMDLSNQSKREINSSNFEVSDPIDEKVQLHPYDADLMLKFLDVSDVHSSAVKAKVRDVVGKGYKIKANFPIARESADITDQHGKSITETEFEQDCMAIQKFIEKCDENETFEDICFKVGMDREAIGWGAFEVIREGSGKIARLQHIPAGRLKVLEGFKGFVEEVSEYGGSLGVSGQRYRYYQPFGQKVGVFEDDPYDLRAKPKKKFRPYDPDIDGELIIGGDKEIKFNLVSKKDGKPLKGSVIRNFNKSANEVLYLPITSNATRYYCYSDIIPAIGAIIANMHIRDYMLQFFEHNCIPRYVVTIKGAKVDDDFMKLITDYFQNKVKGSEHKTLIMALTGFGNKNIEVDFKELGSKNKEADFVETKKANDQVIMISHAIPPSVLAVHETSSLGSGNGRSQTEIYKNRIVLPRQLFWASRLNKLFKLGLGVTNASIEFEPNDLRDNVETATILNLLLLNGVITINEARRHLGLEGAIEGGDTAVIRMKAGSALKVEDLPDLLSNMSNTQNNATGESDLEDIAVSIPKLSDV